MTKNITLREWEALSAFLDNQLSEKDRFRLEARLKQDAELQEALDGLRRTRMVLRSQPRMRAPRNFTLTPAMVGQKREPRSLPRSYPIFRMASAFATLMFIFFFVSDLFGAAPATPAQDFALTSEEMGRRAMAPPGYGEAYGEVLKDNARGSAESQAAPEALTGPADSSTGGFGILTAPGSDEPVPQSPGSEPGTMTGLAEGYGGDGQYGMGGGIEPEMDAPLIPQPYRLGLQVGLLALAVAAGLAALAVRRSAG